ncbi:calcium uptake protein, mitochondrial isoform X2 [Populus trichocarpa]|uniref:calcium uptake protein, mitochondrial isoform X2 n=1 Tax=Populus trichocarpa TaxID=3694 RepID=UPI000D188ABF|nr:calcium uptake protein, mitochondrial isoform X2 [Populus trichocarpa]|eukprot:XP_024446326.1 calcium uptake protein, mitochondrial isoform X2 [Populus trichocarpa]
MPTALTSLKRSRPSIKQLYLIQRLHSRHLSTPSQPNTPLPLITTSTSNTDNHTSKTLSRLFSGLAAGSTFVLLYWSLNDSKPTQFFSFADWSTESKVNDRRLISFLPKLSLPDYSSNYIFGDAFRRKIFFNYEKRIRLRSPPEKVFEYFASLRTPDGEVLMTPEDLMRAVVPVFPPSESHLVRDGYLKGERNPGELRCTSSEFFMLFDVNNDGLISFKEEIDKEEFKKVMALMRAQNRQGAVHRDGLRPGLKVHGSVENGGLVEHFFGKDGKASLRHDKFIQFMRDLNNEILRLEFAHYDYKLRGTISAKDFALSMVASADMSHLGKLLDRVDELNDQANLGGLRITLEEFKSFAELRKKLLPFSLALFSYGKVNGLLMREDFQRAASHVCGVSLSDNVVEIIFHLFDSNHDGSLSADEFVRVLHRRERDIAQPVESGLAGFLSCCFNRAANSPIGRFIS